MVARLAIPAVAIACAIAAAVAVGTTAAGGPTSYAAASGMLHAADIAAGL